MHPVPGVEPSGVMSWETGALGYVRARPFEVFVKSFWTEERSNWRRSVMISDQVGIHSNVRVVDYGL